MKKIMFMMMPLFLTALIFGAGCDQDSSTTRDNDRPVATGDPEIDVPFQPNGLTVADLPWDEYDVIQYKATSGGVLKELKNAPYTDEPFVPAGQALWLSGLGVDADGVPQGPTLTLDGRIIVAGDLIVRAGANLALNNSPDQGTIYLTQTGRLIVNNWSKLTYGSQATIDDVGRPGYSALRSGGIVFNKGSSLDLRPAQASVGAAPLTIVYGTPSETSTNTAGLGEVYANSGLADVYIFQKDITNDQVIEFPVVSTKGLLVVEGLGPGIDSPFTADSITIQKGLRYINIGSTLEGKPVVVNGILEPNRGDAYMATLNIADKASYSNDYGTRIDNRLTVSGEATFAELRLTNETDVRVNTTGELTIGDIHEFNYSPIIDGTLTLLEGARITNNSSLDISNGSLYLGAGSLALTKGKLDSTGGEIWLTYDNVRNNRTITLVENPVFTVNGSLDLTYGGTLSTYNLIRPTDDPEAPVDPSHTLFLHNIGLTGGFTVTGVGTASAQIETLTSSPVTFRNNEGELGGVLNGPGVVEFNHIVTGDEPLKSFIFTGDLLSTEGSLSTLALKNGQSIVFGRNANALNPAGILLADGSYHVESEPIDAGVPGAGTRFAVGYLGNEKQLGIGIGRAGQRPEISGSTSLILGDGSHIRFFSEKDKEQAYLLTGNGLATREGDSIGTESSFFAVKGTQGATATIEVAKVLIVGSLGHASKEWSTWPVSENPQHLLFTKQAGTAATGSLSVPAAGSLTVDHNNNLWTYGANGWQQNSSL
jgi:hypothetical protein